MQQTRRKILCLFGAMAGAMLLPLKLLAAEWNAKAFDETRFSDSLKSVGALELFESDQIELKTPEIAENGAVVPIQVSSGVMERQTYRI